MAALSPTPLPLGALLAPLRCSAVPNLRDQADGSTVTVCVACQTIDANCVQCYTSGNLTNTCTACKQASELPLPVVCLFAALPPATYR